MEKKSAREEHSIKAVASDERQVASGFRIVSQKKRDSLSRDGRPKGRPYEKRDR